MKPERQCQAKSSRSGRRCQKAAIQGGTVCRTHGGAAPQVRRKGSIPSERYAKPRALLKRAGDFRRAWQSPASTGVASACRGGDRVRRSRKKDLAAGDGQTDTICKIRLWDKPKNIELLFKHLGLLVDRVHVTGELETVSSRLIAARKRLAEKAGKAGS